MVSRRVARWIMVGLVFSSLGCEDCGFETRLNRGESCELNSECAAPLVCRLNRCRIECATTADCTIPLACVTDENGLGACQLTDERQCLLDSECPAPLVCRQEQCVNVCEEDVDCVAGARCVDNMGGKACIDMSNIACVFDSECPSTRPGFPSNFYCLDGRCREQCLADRDCGGRWRCRSDNFCCDPSLPGTDPVSCSTSPPDAALDAGPDAMVDAAGDAAVLGCSGSPLTGVRELTAGGNSACAAIGTGAATRVLCWGSFGDIGDPGGLLTSPCPVEVPFLAGQDIVDLETGGGTTCAVLASGAVHCWGNNVLGEAGTGTSTNQQPPTLVPGVTAEGVSTSFGNTCAWAAGMDTFCWGGDAWCSLGRGPLRVCTTFDNARHIPFGPGAVTVVSQPQNVASAGGPMCGIIAGSVECWGTGNRNQLARMGGTMINDAIDVLLGEYHGCALRSGDGSVHCWGGNLFGELGDGTTTDRAAIGPVVGLPGAAIDIASERQHTCAVLMSGAVYCWGNATEGAVHPAQSAMSQPVPQMVIASGATSVHTSSASTCALVGDEVRCWGRNTAGQLGNGTTDVQTTLITVAGP